MDYPQNQRFPHRRSFRLTPARRHLHHQTHELNWNWNQHPHRLRLFQYWQRRQHNLSGCILLYRQSRRHNSPPV